jgi:hypothetical protein
MYLALKSIYCHNLRVLDAAKVNYCSSVRCCKSKLLPPLLPLFPDRQNLLCRLMSDKPLKVKVFIVEWSNPCNMITTEMKCPGKEEHVTSNESLGLLA